MSYNSNDLGVDIVDELTDPVVVPPPEPPLPVPEAPLHVPGTCDHAISEWSFVGHDDVSGLNTYHCDPLVRQYGFHDRDRYLPWSWQQELFWQYYLTLGDDYNGGFLDRSAMADDLTERNGEPVPHHWARFWIRPEEQPSPVSEDLINDYASFHFGRQLLDDDVVDILLSLHPGDYPWVIYKVLPEPPGMPDAADEIRDWLEAHELSDDRVIKVNSANIDDITTRSISFGPSPEMVLAQIPFFDEIDSGKSKYLFDEEDLRDESASSGLGISLISSVDHRYEKSAYIKGSGAGSIPDTRRFAAVEFPLLVYPPDIREPAVAAFGGEKQSGALSDELWLGLAGNEDSVGMPYVRFHARPKKGDFWPPARKGATLLFDRAGESLLLFGGELEGGGLADDLWEYDLWSGEWRPAYAKGGFIRGKDLTVVQTAGSAFVLGGRVGEEDGVIHRFTFKGRVPVAIASLADGPGRRDRASMDLADMRPEKLILYGGVDKAGTVHNDLWELSLDDGTWTRRMADCDGEVSTCPPPSTRPTAFADRDGTRVTVYTHLSTDPNTYYQTDDIFDGWVPDTVLERSGGGTECLFGARAATVADRAQILSPVRSNGAVEVGADAVITGDLSAMSYAFLRERAVVRGNVRVTGAVVRQNGTAVAGEIDDDHFFEPRSIPEKDVLFGTEDVTVDSGNGCDRVLAPGKYRDVHVFAGCTIGLLSGTYDVRRFVLEPDAVLAIPGHVELNVEEAFSFADRASVTIRGRSTDLTVYTNQTAPVYVGESSGFKGTIEAPRARVTVAPFAEYRGCIHANELHIDADAEVRGHNLSPVIITGIACESDADCGDNGHCEAGVCKAPPGPPSSPVTADLTITSDWPEGYCAEVAVHNNGDTALSTWQVVLDTNESQIDNLWNGVFAQNGSEYTVTPELWNAVIEPGGMQPFGFCATKTGGSCFPEVISAGGE